MDSVIFLTGASGGLGRTVTDRLLHSGARVCATYHREAPSAAERLEAIQADVTDAASVARAVETAAGRTGRIDALVNLVGAWSGGPPVHETDDATWRRMLDVNLNSAFLLSRAVLPHLLRQGAGRLIHIGSRAAVDPFPGGVAYIVAKAGVVALTRAIATEVAGRGITANVILPGTIDTPVNRAANPTADYSQWVRPEALAETILFLLSDAAREINGAVIPVYGA
jgi:NAD(P)-dependent dehydrogenase (short-subunit alcohol dehydrogenase family)